MKKTHVTEAVGTALSHDITKIVPGEFKGRAFKKGHISVYVNGEVPLRITGKEGSHENYD